MALTSLLPFARSAIQETASIVSSGLSNGLDAGQSFFQSLQATFSPPSSDSASSTESSAERSSDSSASELERMLDEFHRRLSQRLAAAGIDLREPVQLRSDASGDVLVDDPHPQRASIEKLLAEDRDLTATFQYLAAACSADEALRGPSDESGFGEFRLNVAANTATVVFE